ncbi:MAG: hybrid sensor histidine kinase/response regulator [Bdellovibrionota bacterium]
MRSKILLVDDLEENLLALKSLLSSEDADILTAKSGEAALELMLTQEFALALLDVQMPGMDGFELAEIMRSTEKTRSIPIIFVTAAGNDIQRVFQGYESGAVDFLHKPLFPKIVLSKVKVFLALEKQRKQLEEKLIKIQETEKSLQTALKTRDEFLSICSHELNTPLTSLKMHLQIMSKREEKYGAEVAFSQENVHKFLSNTEKGVERIIHLVNDMLDISRVSTGRLSLHVEDVDFSKLTAETIDRHMPFLSMSNCELTLKIQPNIMVKIDRFRIEQVITNLITNAAKYASECPVQVTLKTQDNKAVLIVADKGPGISEENQKKIFERFERVDSNATVGGLGLGLYISKEIVELHKGQIFVRSQKGQGAEFIVELPL